MSDHIHGNKCWLKDFLEEACRNNMCTKIHCTTCGAMDFRSKLYVKAASAVGIDLHVQQTIKAVLAEGMRNESVLRELVSQLSLLKPDNNIEAKISDAVRLILYEVWNVAGEQNADLLYWPLLGNTWAKEVLTSMREHNKRLLEERRKRDLFESPEAIKERHEKKKSQKQIKHVERLEKKKERDKAWFENHPRDKK